MARRMTLNEPLAAAFVTLALTGSALAETRPTLSFSGAPGLLDMPSGEAMPDATFSVMSAHFGPVSRTSLSFQLGPRLSGTFRYVGVRNWDDVLPASWPTYYDRNFDLRYQVLFEGKYRPAISIGLMDIVGTGQWAGEYIAATKSIGRVKLTAGLGWGRLGSYGSIGAPFGPRKPVDFGMGGNLRLGDLFRGDAAPFAGIEWQVNDRIGLKAEYSSDAYVEAAGSRKTFDRKSPFSFGIEYQVSKALRLGASYMYGSEFGLSAQFVLNPRNSPTGGLMGDGPPALRERAPGAFGWSGEWVQDGAQASAVGATLAKALKTQGITLEAVTLTAQRAEVRVRLPKGENAAMYVGRAARILSGIVPASVETFAIVPMANGLPMSTVVLNRSDLEQLDNAPGQDALMRQRSQILSGSAAGPDQLRLPGVYPKLTWNLGPYLRTSFFDPANPVRADLGLRLSARYELAPGLILSGSLSKKLAGNLDGSDRVSNSVLPHVRSDSNIYDAKGDPTLDNLTLAWYAKPGKDIYSRVTVGYLERMFGGVSAEVLWRPVDRRYAIGAELNYARQRDFDQLFGFQNYDVVTGHVSGYYTFKNGYNAQLDIGRYLAGDYGATLTLSREFANGWKVGAFATLTEVSFEDFGEGSFDKGIMFEIPLAWLTGRHTDRRLGTTIRPVLRDGGARLNVSGRLYDTLHDADGVSLDDQWGKFWR